MLALTAFLVLGVQTAPTLVWDAMPVVTDPTAAGVPMPRRTLVKRGSVIRITGAVPDDGNAIVYVRYGLESKASFKVKGSWSYDWNTASERGPIIKLNLAYRTSDSQPDQPLRQCDVTLVDYEPIALEGTPGAEGSATIKLKVDPKVVIQRPRLFVEGNEIPAAFNHEGQMTLDSGWLGSPNDLVSLQVLGTAAGPNGNPLGVLSTPPARVPANQVLELIDSAPVILRPDDPFETDVAMKFKSLVELKPGTLKGYVGGKPLAGRAEGDSYLFAGIGLDDASQGSFFMAAQDTKGRFVYSKATDASGLGLLKIRDTLEGQRKTERERLRKVYALPSPRLLPHTIISEAPGLTLVTRKLVKHYAPANASGYAEIASVFAQRWADPLEKTAKPWNHFLNNIGRSYPDSDAAKWLKDMVQDGEPRWSKLDQSGYSFMGKFHKRLRDDMLEAHRAWLRQINLLNQSRLNAARSQNYDDLVKFIRELADFEVTQLALNRAAARLAFELGHRPGTVQLTKWVISARSQDDTEIEVKRSYGGFNWIDYTPTPEMYP